MLNQKPPAGLYLVAVAFFIGGIVCIAQLSGVALEALGVDTRLNITTLKWMLPIFVLALCLVCYGAALLARLHPVPHWLMFGMTTFLLVQAIATPAASPFYSVPRIYLNRALLQSPADAIFSTPIKASPELNRPLTLMLRWNSPAAIETGYPT